MLKPKLNIILLKSTADEAKDKYIEHLSSINNIIHTRKLINLLEFEFVNQNELLACLGTLFTSHSYYTTLVLTSNQAVEAIKKLEHFDINEQENDKKKKIDVYCVGEQTKNEFQNWVKTKFSNSSFVINRIVTPCDYNAKQNALELGKIIVQNYSNSVFYGFFPCSSIRKADMVDLLRTHEYKLDELFVYNTIKSQSGLNELSTVLTDLNKSSSLLTVITVFSPSCVDGLFEVLAGFDGDSLSKMNFYFITIGPSTSQRLDEAIHKSTTLKHFKYVELNEPSPSELLNKIQFLYDNQ